MGLLNGLIGTLILIAIYILPLAISIAIAVWVYNSVNRANATLEGIRDELRRLTGAVAKSAD